MSRLCSCCRRPAAPTPANVIAPMVHQFMYAVMWNCECGSTLACVIWELEET